MLLYFFIIFSIYYIFVLLIFYGWKNISKLYANNDSTDFPFASVIIAVRNEEKNIPTLMNCLSNQSYPKNSFEVILVDDYSEDDTVKVIKNAISNGLENVHILKTNFNSELNISPKKSALIAGIDSSKGEIIVMTDGDCWFGEDWLNSVLSAFGNPKTMFVSGPVALKGNRSLLSKIQTIEFSSLMATGGALIGLNYPLMCNGANLAFRKKAFYEVNGYKGYEDNSSGDDVFLMQKIHDLYKNSIAFQKDQRAIVYSFPQPTVTELVNQRKRWASKWNNYLPLLSWSLPVFLFIHYLSFLAAIAIIFIIPKFLLEISALILLKFFLDYIILRKAMVFCKLKFEFWLFLLSGFLYPFYALFIGISVHFGNYQWKGRSHKIKK